MDEAAVEEAISATMSDTAEVEHILARMMRFRDSVDVNADGGCIDVSREYPRWVCPGTCDLVLPGKLTGKMDSGRRVALIRGLHDCTTSRSENRMKTNPDRCH